MKTKLIISSAAFTATAPFLTGAPILPAGLNPGDQFHYVFVSDSTTDATSPNRSHYDGIVAGDATTNGLDTVFGQAATWQALAGVGYSPANTVFDPNHGIYRLDGVKIADNGADLWDESIDNTFSIGPDGSATSHGQVWTGASGDGSNGSGGKSIGLGDDPNIPSNFSNYGSTSATDGKWVFQVMSNDKKEILPLYAFSSPITVPIPEPQQIATGIVAGLAALFSSFRRSRRRKNLSAK